MKLQDLTKQCEDKVEKLSGVKRKIKEYELQHVTDENQFKLRKQVTS